MHNKENNGLLPFSHQVSLLFPKKGSGIIRGGRGGPSSHRQHHYTRALSRNNNLEQFEMIPTEAGKVVVLDFTTFDIGAHHNCDYEYLTILDYDVTTISDKACGDTLPARITSITNKVHLIFVTDHSVTKNVWVINIHSKSDKCQLLCVNYQLCVKGQSVMIDVSSFVLVTHAGCLSITI